VDPALRRPDVKVIAYRLSAVDEETADALLTRSGTRKLVPGGWAHMTRQERQDLLRNKLRHVAPDALEQLTRLISPGSVTAPGAPRVELPRMVGDAEQRAAVQAITEFMVDLEEAEADEILRIAGAHTTPEGWDRRSAPFRRAILTESLRQEGDVTIATLARMAGYEASSLARQMRPASPLSVVDDSGPIFVVHGRAEGIRHEVVRVLERATQREVIVLHEQANSGRTILEKLEAHAARSSYAVVILTADDEGGIAATTLRRPRGRQNVIFELGFFFGKLGRARVSVLLTSGVERPSDVDGLVYIRIDEAGAWKHALARELMSAEIQVEYSRIP